MSDDDDTIKSLQYENIELKRRLRESEAFHPHRLHFAVGELKKFTVEKMVASACILEITILGGKISLGPVAVKGFSDETISALTADLRRTYDYMTELKP